MGEGTDLRARLLSTAGTIAADNWINFANRTTASYKPRVWLQLLPIRWRGLT